MTNSEKSEKKIIGIDLGTTNSCVAVVTGGFFRTIENEEGYRTTPSVVAYTKKGVITGENAKAQSFMNHRNTIYAVKRLIGKKFSELDKHLISSLAYKVVEMSDGYAGIELEAGKNGVSENKVLSPVAISAEILRKMKTSAENFLGYEVKDAVITIPAYFTDSQRHATQDAGKVAGLNVVRLIHEPTAACIAYGIEKKKEKQGLVAVYDLGGGTFDISILDIDESGVFAVKATNGDSVLGGEDFDNRLVHFVTSKHIETGGSDLSHNKQALQRIKEACEKAKKELSSKLEASINLPYINVNEHITVNITRSELEGITSDLIDRTILCCQDVLDSANIKRSDLKALVFVGGMTRMPLVEKKIEEFFGIKASKDINPDECVAIGSAIQGGVLKGDVKDILLIDVTPLSLGIEVVGGVFSKIIERNTPIPSKATQTYSTAEDNQSQVTLSVFQGEREMTVDNILLGQFNLVGIRPAPRGVPKIEVLFEIDANGVLEVSATDKDTNKVEKIKIQKDIGLDKSKIDKMIKEAEINKEIDIKKKNLAETRNMLHNMISLLDKSLKDNSDIITEEIKEQSKKAIENASKSFTDSSEEIEPMKKSMSELQNIISSIDKLKAEAQSKEGKSNKEDDKSNRDTTPNTDTDNTTTTDNK